MSGEIPKIIKVRKFVLSNGIEITFKKYRRLLYNADPALFPPLPVHSWVVEYFAIKSVPLITGGYHSTPIQGSFPCNTASRGVRKLRLVLARELNKDVAKVDDAIRLGRMPLITPQQFDKSMRLGKEYGMGPRKLMDAMYAGAISTEEAQRAIEKFRETFERGVNELTVFANGRLVKTRNDGKTITIIEEGFEL